MTVVKSPLQELADAGRASDNFMINAQFELPRGKVLTVTAYTYRGFPGGRAHMAINESTGKRTVGKSGVSGKDLGDALRLVAADYPKAVLRPEALKLHVRNGPATSAKLKPVVVQAWHEAFGLPVPSLQDLAKQRKAARDAGKAVAGDLVALLRGGPAGVAKFNRRPVAERAKADLRKMDLHGCDLSGVKFRGACLDGSDFSDCTLARAEFDGGAGRLYQRSSLKKSRLARADLTGADLRWTHCGEADFGGARLAGATLIVARCQRVNFTGAVLTGVDAYCGNFQGAAFSRADLTDAKLRCADVRGADFSGATLSGVQFEGSAFDEKTKWPKGYKVPVDLRWKGAGPDPRHAATRRDKKLPKPTDFPGFLARLQNVTDAAKLGKAMAMLKAERFQLFAQVETDHLVGVVKSQSSRDLVYSCRLGADGKYACCTQNLNVCGGLRGSPCKHLLVLVVGLTQAGALDPATAHEWSQAARGRKAELDKDAMTETFLRYKGAEAGEVDWRPTETIPEDFYAV